MKSNNRRVIRVPQRYEIFLEAYEMKNFSEVANKLFISQPTVSTQLKKLEEELGVLLFIRQGPKQVIPTSEADFFYRKLLKIKDEWAYMMDGLKNIQNKKEVCIIACSNTVATNFIPKIFKELQSQFQTLIFEINQMNSEEVIEAMERHEAHIGFVEKPLRHESLNRFAVFEDELVLAGAEEAENWLMREEESGVFYYNQIFLQEKNIQLPIIKVNSNSVIIELLKAGVGKTIASKSSLTTDIPWSDGSSYMRYFYCITRNHPVKSEINRLNQYLLDHYYIKG